MNYYKVQEMNVPTPALYKCENLSQSQILMIGTAQPQGWATTIDIDPLAPADFVGDGCRMNWFRNNQFELVILDFVSNFVSPKKVASLIKEANRVGKRVAGRCHVGSTRTLPGPKQRFPHATPPAGVEWIEII